MMLTNCEVQNKIHLVWHNKSQGFFMAYVISSLRWASFLNRVSISLNQFCIVTTRNVGPVIKCAVGSKSKTRLSHFKIRIILGFATLEIGLRYKGYGNTGCGVFKGGVKNQKESTYSSLVFLLISILISKLRFHQFLGTKTTVAIKSLKTDSNGAH